MTENNMYGVTPCPKCGSKYRWPTQQGTTQCDDCGYEVNHRLDDENGWSFHDAIVEGED